MHATKSASGGLRWDDHLYAQFFLVNAAVPWDRGSKSELLLLGGLPRQAPDVASKTRGPRLCGPHPTAERAP